MSVAQPLEGYKQHKLEELTLSNARLYWRYSPGYAGNTSGPPDSWSPPEPDEIDFVLTLEAEGSDPVDITEFLTDVEITTIEDIVRQLVEEEHDGID